MYDNVFYIFNLQKDDKSTQKHGKKDKNNEKK